VEDVVLMTATGVVDVVVVVVHSTQAGVVVELVVLVMFGTRGVVLVVSGHGPHSISGVWGFALGKAAPRAMEGRRAAARAADLERECMMQVKIDQIKHKKERYVQQ
jgi:hypothetical protein